MRYIGNKTKLLPFLEESFQRYYPDTSDLVLCDLFAGTCSVSSYFKTRFRHVISNDLEDYSVALAHNYICNDGPPEGFQEVIDKLNSLEPITGKFSKAFSLEGSDRMFFTEHNARKIQAIREEIEKYKSNPKMYSFLLCSLLESADAVSNTTGVYGAYLKKFNQRSLKDIVLKAYVPNKGSGTALKGDAVEVVAGLQGDVLYLDPPYNTRKYSSNYHVLNCIINHNDFKIKLNKRTDKESVTGLTEDMNDSDFSSRPKVRRALEKLIENASGFDTVFLSYNNEGILSIEDVEEVLSQYGDYELLTIDHKRYKSNKKSNEKQTNQVVELLHVLRRNK
jgi:adenine-specific DNA-methyltransferase